MNQNNFLEIIRQVPTQKVNWPLLTQLGIELWVRRDDLLDAQISGNKFYKLWMNLEAAKCKGFRRLLTFGGPWSNHIHALAAAGKRFGFETIGLIRGEKKSELNPCLADATRWGMQLHYLSRDQYSRRYDADFQENLEKDFNAFVIPEGGANLQGALGMKLLGNYLQTSLSPEFNAICLACGTGTSLAGLAAGVDESIPVYGFSVLKGDGDLVQTLQRTYRALKDPLIIKNTRRKNETTQENWRLITGFHAGGYAKKHPEYLKKFWNDFEEQTQILLDPVYTLKLFWGIAISAQQGSWPRGHRLLAIHTGGLQGRRGFEQNST